MSEENRKEHVMEETEAIVNEASQENQDIEAKENPNPEEGSGAGGCAGLKDGTEAEKRPEKEMPAQILRTERMAVRRKAAKREAAPQRRREDFSERRRKRKIRKTLRSRN